MALQTATACKPGDGEVLVTGAAGGVGSVAVALLGSLGYTVVASTGTATGGGLPAKACGAKRIVERSEFAQAGKPLQKECWAGVVDTVGSHTLANACAANPLLRRGGGLRAGAGRRLPTTVMPFILRGVTLYGINSVLVPNAQRARRLGVDGQAPRRQDSRSDDGGNRSVGSDRLRAALDRRPGARTHGGRPGALKATRAASHLRLRAAAPDHVS